MGDPFYITGQYHDLITNSSGTISNEELYDIRGRHAVFHNPAPKKSDKELRDEKAREIEFASRYMYDDHRPGIKKVIFSNG